MSRLPNLAMPEVLISPEESAKATAVYADWSDLVERIRSGNTDGMQELYQLFSRGIRYYLARQFGFSELDHRVHDTLVAVVQAIRSDQLSDPERLMGFVSVIVQRQVAAHIDHVDHRRKPPKDTVFNDLRRENPEEAVAFQRRTELIDQVLESLSQREREILTRFYLQEQSPDLICTELAVTETQFRLLKSRAKARFQEMGRQLVGEFSPAASSNPCRPRDVPHKINRTQSSDSRALSIGPSQPLGVERILPVVAHTIAVFGDEKKAHHWLVTPLPLLGDRPPSQLLDGQEGIELVEQILTRIEHNIPS